MQRNEYYGYGFSTRNAGIAGDASDMYGQQQQYHGHEHTEGTLGQDPCVAPGHWPNHALPQPPSQPSHQPMHAAYGQAMPAAPGPSAAAYSMPMQQQLLQAAPAPDQYDDSLRAVRDMPTPFQQLYSYR